MLIEMISDPPKGKEYHKQEQVGPEAFINHANNENEDYRFRIRSITKGLLDNNPSKLIKALLLISQILLTPLYNEPLKRNFLKRG